MEVTKVKFHDAATTVEFAVVNGRTPQKSQLEECPDMRRSTFEDARAAVALDVVEILDMGKKVSERYRFTQVSVSKNANGRRGFIFHGMFRTSAGEVSLQTPLMRESVDGEASENTLSDVARKRIDQLLEEAVAYVAGQREQGELGLENQAAAGGVN